nr:MAG TPA: replisome organizer [Caudoviricetes sp.]
MTAQEASGFLSKLALAYPAQYARLGAAELKGQIELWSGTMEGYSLEQAVVGLRVFLRGDTKGFAPVPGQVIDCIERVQRPAEDGYTNTECISLIRRAIGDALYHAEEAFERLPELCKRAVGTPRNLTEWAQLDTSVVETVISSQIIRALEATRVRMREDAKLPPSVREALRVASEPLYAVEKREREQALLEQAKQMHLDAAQSDDTPHSIAEAENAEKVAAGEKSLAEALLARLRMQEPEGWGVSLQSAT